MPSSRWPRNRIYLLFGQNCEAGIAVLSSQSSRDRAGAVTAPNIGPLKNVCWARKGHLLGSYVQCLPQQHHHGSLVCAIIPNQGGVQGGHRGERGAGRVGAGGDGLRAAGGPLRAQEPQQPRDCARPATCALICWANPWTIYRTILNCSMYWSKHPTTRDSVAYLA